MLLVITTKAWGNSSLSLSRNFSLTTSATRMCSA